MIRRRPLATAVGQALPAQQQGFGLLGIIVTAVLGFAVLGVAYTVYRQGELSANATSGAASARDIANRVQAAYASAPNFDLLNNTSASRDRLWPGCPPVPTSQEANPPPCPAPVNPWGATVQVAGTPTGFAVTLEQVPAAACVRLVSASATGWAGITVNGSSVMKERTVQPSVAFTLCKADATATVQFLSGKAAGASLPPLTACVPPAPQSQTLPCPSGQISSVAPYGPDGITQTRAAFCNGAYGNPGWTSWTTVTDTCAPQCMAPTPTTATGTQSAGCPGGQVTASGATSFGQTNTTITTYACPAPTGPYTPTVGTPSPWSPTVASVCAPKCVAPAPTTNTGTQPASCPSGQVTASGATSFTQTRTRPVTYACPSPQGNYTTTPGAWSAWSPAAASVCAPKCVAPGPSTKKQTLGCPSDQTGSITQQQTTTYSCPSPQGSAVGTAGAWVTTSNNCTTPAPPPAHTWKVQEHPGNQCSGPTTRDQALAQAEATIATLSSACTPGAIKGYYDYSPDGCAPSGGTQQAWFMVICE